MERDGVKDLFAIEFSLRARGLQINRMILKADEKKEREWYFFLKKVLDAWCGGGLGRKSRKIRVLVTFSWTSVKCNVKWDKVETVVIL